MADFSISEICFQLINSEHWRYYENFEYDELEKAVVQATEERNFENINDLHYFLSTFVF